MSYKLEIRLDGELYHAHDSMGNELCRTRMEAPVVVLMGDTVEEVMDKMREIATTISNNGKTEDRVVLGAFICFPGQGDWEHICFN